MKGPFDEALECLRGTGSEVADGVAPNHGPMAAEALVALGRDDVVVAWARRYRRKLDAMPSPVRPFRQKAGHRHSEPLIGSQTGSLFFARKWPRHHGGLCSESGSVVCCPRRLRPAATDSFALRTLFARCQTPRHRCASKSSELPWHTGLPTTVSSLAPRTS